MRSTATLDDRLVRAATAPSGLEERSALPREAPTALIERESAGRPARPGGTEPDLEASAPASPVILADTSGWSIA